jgi:predicted histone-like DNA-binding protein
MAILYEVKERKNPQTPGVPGKYYPAVVRTQTITFNALTKEIAARSTVSKADAAAVLYSLEELIIEHLKNSNGVRLGSLGTIYPTLTGKGAPSVAEFNAGEHIDGVRVRFLPAKALKDEVQNTDFRKVEMNP